jgi:hypothetical protein
MFPASDLGFGRSGSGPEVDGPQVTKYREGEEEKGPTRKNSRQNKRLRCVTSTEVRETRRESGGSQ